MRGYRPARQRRLSLSGVLFIAKWEGFRSCPYADLVGVWTVGYGHTSGVGPGSPCIGRVAALRLARKDARSAANAVRENVKVQLTQHQFDALVSLVFNLGPGEVMNESTSTLLRLLNAGDYSGAADQFKRWDNAGGGPVQGLLDRRLEEAAIFRKPPKRR